LIQAPVPEKLLDGFSADHFLYSVDLLECASSQDSRDQPPAVKRGVYGGWINVPGEIMEERGQHQFNYTREGSSISR